MKVFLNFVLAWLVLPVVACAETTNAPLVTISILESNVVYMRVTKVTAGLADELKSLVGAPPAANNVIGTVLDLRFGSGNDSGAVVGAANFVAAKQLPLVILMNSETRGAAVTFLAALRSRGAGLVFGSEADGIKPDVEVSVKADEEIIYFADAYAVLTNRTSAVETNPVSRDTNRLLPKVNEADLVRARRAGAFDPEAEAEVADKSTKPVIRDPVLGRALDLLQGLAVVRQKRGD